MTIQKATIKPLPVYFIEYTGEESEKTEIREWFQGSNHSLSVEGMSNSDGSVIMDIDVVISKVGSGTRYEALLPGTYVMKSEEAGFFLVDAKTFKDTYDVAPTPRGQNPSAPANDWSFMRPDYKH